MYLNILITWIRIKHRKRVFNRGTRKSVSDSTFSSRPLEDNRVDFAKENHDRVACLAGADDEEAAAPIEDAVQWRVGHPATVEPPAHYE